MLRDGIVVQSDTNAIADRIPPINMYSLLGPNLEDVLSVIFPIIGSVMASHTFPTIGIAPASAAGMPRALVRKTKKKVLMITKAPPP